MLRRNDVRELLLEAESPGPLAESFYLEDADQMTLMRDALAALFRDEDRIIRVVGQTQQGAQSEIEVTLHEGPLHEALVGARAADPPTSPG